MFSCVFIQLKICNQIRTEKNTDIWNQFAKEREREKTENLESFSNKRTTEGVIFNLQHFHSKI